MKKFFLVSVIAVSILILFASCNSEKGYTIEGKISGGAEGKMVYLCTADNPFNLTPFDSTVIHNGRFKFSGELPHPERYVIKIFPNDNRGNMENNGYVFRPIVPLFVSGGKITVEAHIDSIPSKMSIIDGFSYDYSKVKIAGQPEMMQYMEYITRKNVFVNRINEAYQIYMDWYKNEEENNSKLADLDMIGIAKRNAVEYAINFIEQHKNDMISAVVFSDNLIDMTAGDIDRVIKTLPQEIKDHPLMKEALDKALEVHRTAVGSAFADYMLHDKDGNDVRLSDHAGKGRHVLLDFWASWCYPCRADIPHLKKIYELYHQDGFDIISISIDEDKNNWLKALAKEQMPWLQVSSDLKALDELSKLYNFTGIPTCIFIAPDGVIIDCDMRGPFLVKKMIELYGNKFDK